jgi:hypothetical protein
MEIMESVDSTACVASVGAFGACGAATAIRAQPYSMRPSVGHRRTVAASLKVSMRF